MTSSSGLQAERTVLAWTRTLLLSAAVAALIARTADSGFERGVAVALAALGLALAALTATRRRRGIITGDPVAMAPTGTFGLLVTGFAVLTTAGVVVIL
ncbi:MAG: DUF202 domain-containing protein [Ilumatobacteraceae bacterium]